MDCFASKTTIKTMCRPLAFAQFFLTPTVVSHSPKQPLFLMYYCLFIRLFGYFINLRVPGRALGFHRRNSRGDWHLYRRPSADDRRGFPKPGRCTKHNRHGVFPVGINQSCGNPSFQLSDILFFFIILVLSLFSLFSHTSVFF